MNAIVDTATAPTSTAEIIAHCQALFDDLDFTAARAWKNAVPGRKVVGFLPVYAPLELIHAAGCLPLGLFGGGDRMEVIHGDAYYQSYICRIPRSTVELGVTGRLDFVDGMIFPFVCDVIRNLSGMWKIMFPNVWSKFFDTPQNFDPEIGGRYYAAELQEMREGLETLTGRTISRRRHPPLDRALQRQPPAGARGLRLPGAHAVEGADLGSLPADARRPDDGGRGAQPAACRLSRRRRGGGPAEARQCPHRDLRLVLRAAAAEPDQVGRDGRLLRGRGRLRPGQPLPHPGRAGRGRSDRGAGDRLSRSTRSRPPASTCRARRTRASSTSSR